MYMFYICGQDGGVFDAPFLPKKAVTAAENGADAPPRDLITALCRSRP